MMGPKSSGRMAASSMTAQPAWQLPIDCGLALGFGMQRNHPLEKDGLGVRDVLDGLPGDRLGQKADEVAGMPCL